MKTSCVILLILFTLYIFYILFTLSCKCKKEEYKQVSNPKRQFSLAIDLSKVDPNSRQTIIGKLMFANLFFLCPEIFKGQPPPPANVNALIAYAIPEVGAVIYDVISKKIASKIALKAAIKEVGTEIIESLLRKTISFLKFSPKLLYSFVKANKTRLARYGIQFTERGLTKLALATGEMLADDIIKTGPDIMFTKFDIFLLAFDTMNLILDTIDPLQYGNVTHQKTINKVKEDADKEFDEMIRSQDDPSLSQLLSRPVVGPLDNINGDDYVQLILDNIAEIITDKDKMSKFYVTFASAINTGKIDLQNADALSTFIDNNLEFESVINNAVSNVCVNRNGMVVNGMCSYKTRQECNNSITFPVPEGEIYREWTDNYKFPDGYAGPTSGACQWAPTNVRELCNNINKDKDSVTEPKYAEYDINTGMCNITKDYCTSKGLDWKNKDCKLDTTQNIAEIIFGVTTTRSLRQTFDPSNYKPCNADEVDDGYLCRKKNCPEDTETENSMCYKKCPSGYSGEGPLCWKNCPSKTSDIGVSCHKDSYALKAGYVPKVKCDKGWTSRGVGTAGWCDNGAPHTKGKGCCCIRGSKFFGTKDKCCGCQDGYVDTGCTCQKKLQTKAATFECDEGDYLDNGLCYEKCKDGYTNVGPRCWLNCPSGFRDDGVYCAKKTTERGSGFFPPVRPKERKVTYG